MAATEQKPKALDKKVLNALGKSKVKVSDLTPEQRARAESAAEHHSGLAGNALATWILDGENLGAQVERARQDQLTRGRAEQAAARVAGGDRRSQYPDEVRAAVKRSNELRGKSHGAGPKQHVHVRAVVRKELGIKANENPSKAGLLSLAGVANAAELFAVAAGEAGRDELAKLRPLGQKMGDDAWCKGRHLAGALAAWLETL